MGLKKDDAPPTFVFKLNINCDDCAKTIKTKAREFSGVEDVKVDTSTNELTVIGNVDATKVRDYLMKEFPKKGVKLVSPLPKEDASDVKKEQDKEPEENESTKVNREMTKMEELIKRLTQELEDARDEAERARNEAARVQNEAELTVMHVEQISQELDEARNEAKHVRNEAEVTVIQVEQISQELEEARNEAERARNEVARARNEANINQDCAICQTNKKDMAFGCGHMTCEECGKMLSTCHICREPITIRIKLFP